MNLIRNWKRIMAIGCTHGNRQNDMIVEQALEFADKFLPEIRVHLGDVVDTAAFRSGAAGSADECEPIGPDRDQALDLLDCFRPTHITWGNHDWRLWELSRHPKAIIAEAAHHLRSKLENKAREFHAVTADYDIERNWIPMGGVHFGHGFMYNMNAVRDHAEMVGGPVVMAHLHKPEAVRGRTLKHGMSYCVGTLADISSLHYARRRRATTQWEHGFVYGEICEDDARLNLITSRPNEPFVFPSGVL